MCQDFFRKHGVAVMAIRELFDFIVDLSIPDDSVDEYLEEVQQKIQARENVISAEDEIADSVFIQSFIPKTLDQVKNVEEDVIRLTSGKDTADMYYQTITGLKQALGNHEEQKGTPQKPEEVNKGDSKEEEAEAEKTGRDDMDEEDDSESEGSSGDEWRHPTPTVDRKIARKENKKKVKEEKREARKNKVPKAVKKRREKVARSNKR
ncbi:hypothetical protein SAY86_029846 [Trapa natans]|uniref:Uncharacterized protein n=1 Tax=Trapa natans TaxID=22666 RepID=A0AAN7M1X7_TRANT|nr:hypothetical protein SAY86_029846 [Trapa natans]